MTRRPDYQREGVRLYQWASSSKSGHSSMKSRAELEADGFVPCRKNGKITTQCGSVLMRKAMSEPTVQCDRCGFTVVVNRFMGAEFPPGAAKRLFRKCHRDCGVPVYRAGVATRGVCAGQMSLLEGGK